MRTGATLVLLTFLGGACSWSCGGGGGGEPTASASGQKPATADPAGDPPPSPQEAGGRKPWTPAAGTGKLEGSVSFTGQAPRRRPISVSGDPKCSAMHASPPLEETVIVNANQTLRNVFVWVRGGLQGWTFTAPKEAVVLDQRGCVYTPHVFGVQVGQPLVVRNSDDVLHNVHSLSTKNPSFNFSQARQGEEKEITFRFPEVMFRIKCDVHGWMTTYAGAVPHPFFAVTGEDGTFSLPSLPPGKFTVEAWHEKFGTRTMEVELADGETRRVEFSFGGE